MKIYISGGNGMVGRNISSNPDVARHDLLLPGSKVLNLMDYDSVLAFLKENMPDMIIHCAGKVGGIQANMKNMTDFFYYNAVMGLNLVRAAFTLGIKKVINLSSSCTYPKDLGRPLTEEDFLLAPLEPTNEGYALAKICVLKLCDYITREHEGYLYKTLVPCNLYGKWDKFGEENAHMIPSIIRKIHKAKEKDLHEIMIWGDGKARREFMCARDLADCVARAITNFTALPNIMNVGLGFDYTVNEYYETAARVMGYDGVFSHDLTKPVGMNQKLLDITKQKAWGWEGKISLEDGIKETYEYYKSEVYNA